MRYIEVNLEDGLPFSADALELLKSYLKNYKKSHIDK